VIRPLLFISANKKLRILSNIYSSYIKKSRSTK
jgi:hypothetical protein